MKRNVRLNDIPRNKNFDEFPKPDKTVSQETKASYQSKNNRNIMRSGNSFSFKSKPCSEPCRTGIRIGAPQPFGQEHHIKHLVKNRPQPGNPDTFETIYKAQRYHPHSAADIEHVGSVTKAEKIPRQFFSSQQIAFFGFAGLLPEIHTYQQHGNQVDHYYAYID